MMYALKSGNTKSNLIQTPFTQQLYLRCPSRYADSPQALGYTMGKTLGSGTYAKVKAAWSPFQDQMIAIKNIKKNKHKPNSALSKFLPREIEVLQKLSHPNVMKVFQIVETDVRCFMALEIAENGDLDNYIDSRGFIPEAEARFIFTQMCEAISYCHSLDVVHRDLKCDNVLLTKSMDIKIGDFGYALDLSTQSCVTPCGTLCYVAPEVFTTNGKEYDSKKTDSWSMGVILYTMLCGVLPFGDNDVIQKGHVQYTVLQFCRKITEEGKALIQSLLSINSVERPFVRAVLACDWMTSAPSMRPSAPAQCKYTPDTCLPAFLQKRLSGGGSWSKGLCTCGKDSNQISGTSSSSTTSATSSGTSSSDVSSSSSNKSSTSHSVSTISSHTASTISLTASLMALLSLSGGSNVTTYTSNASSQTALVAFPKKSGVCNCVFNSGLSTSHTQSSGSFSSSESGSKEMISTNASSQTSPAASPNQSAVCNSVNSILSMPLTQCSGSFPFSESGSSCTSSTTNHSNSMASSHDAGIFNCVFNEGFSISPTVFYPSFPSLSISSCSWGEESQNKPTTQSFHVAGVRSFQRNVSQIKCKPFSLSTPAINSCIYHGWSKINSTCQYIDSTPTNSDNIELPPTQSGELSILNDPDISNSYSISVASEVQSIHDPDASKSSDTSVASEVQLSLSTSSISKASYGDSFVFQGKHNSNIVSVGDAFISNSLDPAREHSTSCRQRRSLKKRIMSTIRAAGQTFAAVFTCVRSNRSQL